MRNILAFKKLQVKEKVDILCYDTLSKPMILSNCAEVLRCQLKRERLNRAGETVKLADRYICHEMTCAEIDPFSGFLEANDELICAAAGREGEKYLLRQGDILMTFSGGIERIGEVGLVARPVEGLVLPSRTLCIIRPKPETDGIWLFYTLREMRERIKGMATGPRPGAQGVNLADLRKLEIPLPKGGEAEAIHKIHDQVLQTVIYREALNKNIQQYIGQSHSVFLMAKDKHGPVTLTV